MSRNSQMCLEYFLFASRCPLAICYPLPNAVHQFQFDYIIHRNYDRPFLDSFAIHEKIKVKFVSLIRTGMCKHHCDRNANRTHVRYTFYRRLKLKWDSKFVCFYSECAFVLVILCSMTWHESPNILRSERESKEKNMDSFAAFFLLFSLFISNTTQFSPRCRWNEVCRAQENKK